MINMHSLTKKVKGAILIQTYEKKNNAVISGIVGAAIGCDRSAGGIPVPQAIIRKPRHRYAGAWHTQSAGRNMVG